ncbi:MAG: YqiJ family protein [Epulopiscium sp.]|nr:YqiJ family protein [Candidatus Epulonipiscium sp.]
MIKVFHICFGVGAGFTVLSFALGQIFDFLGLDGITDIELDADWFGFGISPLKPVVLTAFLTVFGGIGTILTNKGFSPYITISIALACGVFISALLYRFIIVPLHNAQNTSAVAQQALIGHAAKVTLSISEDQMGRISYIVYGNTYSAPAKPYQGEHLQVGDEVIITDIHQNIFYVKRR